MGPFRKTIVFFTVFYDAGIPPWYIKIPDQTVHSETCIRELPLRQTLNSEGWCGNLAVL